MRAVSVLLISTSLLIACVLVHSLHPFHVPCCALLFLFFFLLSVTAVLSAFTRVLSIYISIYVFFFFLSVSPLCCCAQLSMACVDSNTCVRCWWRCGGDGRRSSSRRAAPNAFIFVSVFLTCKHGEWLYCPLLLTRTSTPRRVVVVRLLSDTTFFFLLYRCSSSISSLFPCCIPLCACQATFSPASLRVCVCLCVVLCMYSVIFFSPFWLSRCPVPTSLEWILQIQGGKLKGATTHTHTHAGTHIHVLTKIKNTHEGEGVRGRYVC